MTHDDGTGEVDAFGRKVQPQQPTLPQCLVLARWLWIASTGTGLVRSFIQLADRKKLLNELHKQAPQLSTDQLNGAANSGILFTLLLSLAVFGLYVTLANRMAQGRRWARVLIAVLGAASVIGTLFTFGMVATMGTEVLVGMTGVQVNGFDLLFSAVVMVLDAVVLVLLFRPDANRYFRDAAKRGHATTGNGGA